VQVKEAATNPVEPEHTQGEAGEEKKVTLGKKVVRF